MFCRHAHMLCVASLQSFFLACLHMNSRFKLCNEGDSDHVFPHISSMTMPFLFTLLLLHAGKCTDRPLVVLKHLPFCPGWEKCPFCCSHFFSSLSVFKNKRYSLYHQFPPNVFGYLSGHLFEFLWEFRLDMLRGAHKRYKASVWYFPAWPHSRLVSSYYKRCFFMRLLFSAERSRLVSCLLYGILSLLLFYK